MIPATYSPSLVAHQPRSKRVLARAGFLSARFVGILLLAVFALLYVAQESQGATRNVEAQSYKSEVNTLIEKQQQLEIDALRLKSIDGLSQSAPQLGLEPVESVEYLGAHN